MSEQSRKHGWFDPRYPVPDEHSLAIRPEGRRPVGDGEGLGWADFVASCYPGSHRHELLALTAYATYREARVEAVVRELHDYV